jgi:D-cysteine desulfhydrase
MLLFRVFGAELLYLKGVLRTGASLMITQRLLNPRAYILDAGGSSPIGTVGIVNAMFELKEQIDAGLLPEPRYIFCPLGSNGTMAGLSLGALLAGIAATVVGVRVTMESVGPVAVATPKTVASLMRKTYSLLKKYSSRIPDVAIEPQEVLQGYVGDGYGCTTGECLDAMELVREKEGLELDPTYTSKTFAALIDFIKKPEHAKDPILYWHTYNSADLSEKLRSCDCRELPSVLRRIYETETEQEA